MSGLRSLRDFARRARTAAGYYRGPLAAMARWLFESRETTNFTYELDERNQRHLAALVADVMEIGFDAAFGYLRELEEDAGLREHVGRVTRERRADAADAEARYGRRAGWYAVARALKPRLIVETGVDKGLGACVLAAALKRNALEGHPGTYCGTDIDRGAGWLLCGEYASFGRVLYGDSLASLRGLDGTIELFINDSEHSADYEAQEYRAIAGKLSPRAVILGDNAHATDALLEFSRQSGRRFVFFQERPLKHWYPGAGIGFSFRREGR